jgi:hypothetical protein
MKKFKFDKNSKCEILYSNPIRICNIEDKNEPISNSIEKYIKLGIEKGVIKKMIFIPIRNIKNNQTKFLKLTKNGAIHKQLLEQTNNDLTNLNCNV